MEKRTMAALLALPWLFTAGLGAEAASNSSDPLLQKAQTLIAQGRPVLALPLLREARRLNPDNEQVWRMQIQALRAAGGESRQGNREEQARAIEAEAKRRFPNSNWDSAGAGVAQVETVPAPSSSAPTPAVAVVTPIVESTPAVIPAATPIPQPVPELAQPQVAAMPAQSAAGGGAAADLKTVIERVIKTNPEILGSATHRRSVEQELKGTKGGYLPKVDLAAGVGREKADTPSTRASGVGTRQLTRHEAGLTLRQMLFDGFGVSSEVKRQEARVNSAAFQSYSTAEDVSLNAVEAYLEVLRQRELVALAKDNLDNHQHVFDQIKLRSQSGVGRKADMDQAQARLSLAQSNLLATQSFLKDGEAKYRLLVGQDPGNLVKPAVPEQSLPKSEAQAVESALNNHPLLKSALADVEAAKAQHAAAKSLLYPRVDLELSADRNKNLSGLEGANNDTQAMLRMRYNLFNGQSDKARVDQTNLLVQEATEVSNKTKRQVEQAASTSWNAYATARDRLVPLQEYVSASGAAWDAYTKQFNLGQRSLLDVLDSENEYYTARTALVNGQYTQIFGAFRVLQTGGRLLDSLGVALPEETKISSKAAKLN